MYDANGNVVAPGDIVFMIDSGAVYDTYKDAFDYIENGDYYIDMWQSGYDPWYEEGIRCPEEEFQVVGVFRSRTNLEGAVIKLIDKDNVFVIGSSGIEVIRFGGLPEINPEEIEEINILEALF